MEAGNRVCNLVRVIQSFCRGPESLAGGSDGRHRASSLAWCKPSTWCGDFCMMQIA